MIPARELIYAIRGVPNVCWACEKTVDPDLLEPEEGGVWWCRDCISQWETEHGEHFADGSPL